MTKKSKIPKGFTAKQYAKYLLWLSQFTDCKEVVSVPSSNKKKVQRKTNKLIKSSQANV